MNNWQKCPCCATEFVHLDEETTVIRDDDWPDELIVTWRGDKVERVVLPTSERFDEI